MNRKSVISLLVLLSGTALQAQDTARSLPEFVFSEQKEKQLKDGFNRETLDSLLLSEYRNRNLADYLSEQSSVFVKSYGLGSLASLSLRGSAASQTAVLWNGLNLQSPMNGQIDIALLPGFFTDKASIQYGSASASWGSGAVGGALIVNNNTLFGKGLITEAGYSAGSFGQSQSLLKLGYGRKRFFIQTRAMQLNADNDFAFRNTSLAGSPRMKQVNADMNQTGVMSEAGFIPKLNNNIIIRHWYQQTYRGIPPVMSQLKSKSYQEDKSTRATIEWNRNVSKLSTALKAAWFDETIDFLTEDSSFNHNRARSIITQAEASRKFRHFRSIFTLLNNYSWAESGGFEGMPAQNRFAAFISLSSSFLDERVKMLLTLREELVDDQLVPFTPSFSAEWEYYRKSSIGANVSRTYRLPTFNDLFWNTGNPDLLPETGWNAEVFASFKKDKQDWNFESKLAAYTRKIDNWIIWLPKVGFWSPQNVASVWSRGAEAFLKLGYTRKDWQSSLDAGISYVRSTNTLAKTENDNSVGMQLIYVPLFAAQSRFMLAYKGIRFSLSGTYTGYRYISTDNSDYLDPYVLLRTRISWRGILFRQGVDIYAESSNLGAAEYQVIAQRPMPGRTFLAGIYINFSNLTSCCKKSKL